MRRIRLSFFDGHLVVDDALELAVSRFIRLPWKYYEGVPDADQGRILQADCALAKVIDDRWDNQVAEQFLVSAGRPRAQDRLARIRKREDIMTFSASAGSLLDMLFNDVNAAGVSLSQFCQVLCRKRMWLVPMLRPPVLELLDEVWQKWERDEGCVPKWFDVYRRDSDNHPVSRYLRMVRDEVLMTTPRLLEMREELSSLPVGDIPYNAPLLRVWETVLTEACIGSCPDARK